MQQSTFMQSPNTEFFDSDFFLIFVAGNVGQGSILPPAVFFWILPVRNCQNLGLNGIFTYETLRYRRFNMAATCTVAKATRLAPSSCVKEGILRKFNSLTKMVKRV